MCVLDLSVLKSAVLGDKQYNLGAIIARRLHNNAKDGDFFGGIYATRLANYLGVPIREDDMELPHELQLGGELPPSSSHTR